MIFDHKTVNANCYADKGEIGISCGVKCYTAQKMKFSVKDFFSKCDLIRSLLQVYSHFLKKS